MMATYKWKLAKAHLDAVCPNPELTRQGYSLADKSCFMSHIMIVLSSPAEIR